MQTKKLIVGYVLVGGVVLLLSVWWGRERWEISGIQAEEASSALSNIYEQKITADSDSMRLKYNLAVTYYHQEKYSEAAELLQEVLNSGMSDKALNNRVLYNLGNVMVRLSEKEADPAAAITLLSESLKYYRAVLDHGGSADEHIADESEEDEDARFNFAIVRRKIKILNDNLNKMQEAATKEKELYQVLQELILAEEAINAELKVLEEADPLARDTLTKRDELSRLRQENLKRLELIKGKIDLQFAPPTTSAGGASGSSPKTI